MNDGCPWRVHAFKGKWKSNWKYFIVTEHTYLLSEVLPSHRNISCDFVAKQIYLDEPPGICSCAGQVLSPEDLIRLLRLVCGISPPPKIHTNLRKFGIVLLINSVSSG